MSAIVGPLRRLLAASVTGSLLVAGCASGGGRDEPDRAASAPTSSTLEATPRSEGASPPPTALADGTDAAAAGADDNGVATDPPPGAEPAPATDGGEDAAVYVAPAGRYEYDTSGFVESGSGPTKTRREPPPVSVDDVTVVESERGVEVTTRTIQEEDSSQVLTVLVAGGEARLTRLTYESTTGGVTTEYRVTPDPPILVARLPYTVGDRWESAWRDDALGIQGVGWGAVREHVHVTTPAGGADTFVLELHQRVQGSFDGELHFTAWIDPATGVVFRQETVTVFRDPTGVSRSEITRVLRARPAAG